MFAVLNIGRVLLNMTRFAVPLLLLLLFSCTGADRGIRDLQCYERLAAAQDWETLAGTTKANYIDHGDEVDANYWCLAQAYRGRLVEDLFLLPRQKPDNLVFVPEKLNYDPRLAHILFAMGNMAGAQNIAFNSLFTPEGYDYAMLKIVAQVEMMRGNDRVAEKYLKILRRQKEWRGWASDASNDPQIERGRKDFPKEDHFISASYPISDLPFVLDANPSDFLAMQYALSHLLLSKDLEGLAGFIDRYSESPALKTLPLPVQEALVYWAEYKRNVDGDPFVGSWAVEHGVGEEVFRNFADFQDAVLGNGQQGAFAFKSTFWYYLMFEKI